jgi:hypothetical protein
VDKRREVCQWVWIVYERGALGVSSMLRLTQVCSLGQDVDNFDSWCEGTNRSNKGSWMKTFKMCSVNTPTLTKTTDHIFLNQSGPSCTISVPTTDRSALASIPFASLCVNYGVNLVNITVQTSSTPRNFFRNFEIFDTTGTSGWQGRGNIETYAFCLHTPYPGIQIGMIRPIRVDHTKFLQSLLKHKSFHSLISKKKPLKTAGVFKTPVGKRKQTTRSGRWSPERNCSVLLKR